MSRRLQVLQAVEALVRAVLPDADVVGLEGSTDEPDRIGPGGRAIIRPGDPGTPEVDLSPLTYNYQHPIPFELAAIGTDALTPAEQIDAMLDAIAEAIEADRFLGGLVDYLDANAPETADLYVQGAAPAHEAAGTIDASYSTTRPL